ncbi:hypothetical protein CF15_06665 [Pyrodictium occultum]|uniref:Triphosphoribosyl-dephospho-CoA synthase n=1 Tax=Pyrodictium occultum TaxID=2309 RepID=A0A0V8RWJ2_PYROC|nr:triphosphoribosyl-dephospho-CoA synthase [Pyrodictium occultum]KSW12405.1 hypothetical protein CF15_06665 [Pyrodictium occultum]
MEPEVACRLFARACSAAVAVDAAVPRPGLTSFQRPRRDLDPLAFAGLTGLAYEACLCSCLAAAAGELGAWPGCWLAAVEDMAAAWGNPGLGSLFLLTLQAAGLGYAEARGRRSLEAVMASTGLAVDAGGVEAAAAFYRGLQLASPSYLARISWSGLPEVDGRLSIMEVWEKRVTLRELLEKASLYDPVSRDAAGMMRLSLGMALPTLLEEECLGRGVRRATYLLAGLEGDLLVSRKSGRVTRELWLRAARGDPGAEEELWRLLAGAGPGSAADLVVNAVARLIYEYLSGLRPRPRLHCGFRSPP